MAETVEIIVKLTDQVAPAAKKIKKDPKKMELMLERK